MKSKPTTSLAILTTMAVLTVAIVGATEYNCYLDFSLPCLNGPKDTPCSATNNIHTTRTSKANYNWCYYAFGYAGVNGCADASPTACADLRQDYTCDGDWIGQCPESWPQPQKVTTGPCN